MSAVISATWPRPAGLSNKLEAGLALGCGMLCAGWWWRSRKSQQAQDATLQSLRSELAGLRLQLGKQETNESKAFRATQPTNPSCSAEEQSSNSMLESTLDYVFSLVAGEVGHLLASQIHEGGKSDDLIKLMTDPSHPSAKNLTGMLRKTLDVAWSLVDKNHDGLLDKEENDVLVSSYLKCLARWVPVVVDAGVDSMIDHMWESSSSVQGGWRSNADLMLLANMIKHHFTAGMTREHEAGANKGACFGQSPEQIWQHMDANSDGQVVKEEFVDKFLAAIRIIPTVVNTGSQAAKCAYNLVTDQSVGKVLLNRTKLTAEITAELDKTKPRYPAKGQSPERVATEKTAEI